jgi:hypothetical protein
MKLALVLIVVWLAQVVPILACVHKTSSFDECLDGFYSWCQAKGIHIGNVKIQRSPLGGLGLFATEDLFVSLHALYDADDDYRIKMSWRQFQSHP